MNHSPLSPTSPGAPADARQAVRAERAARFQHIREALARHERTEAWLARQWGVSRQAIQRYKAGLSTPELSNVIQACAALGIPVPSGYLTTPTRHAQLRRAAATAQQQPPPVKRPRGRPRKHPRPHTHPPARDGPPHRRSANPVQ